MQNFQRNWDMQSSAGSQARGVITGVGKGIVGVFTKPIGGAAELVSQTGYGKFRKVKDDSMFFSLISFKSCVSGLFFRKQFQSMKWWSLKLDLFCLL